MNTDISSDANDLRSPLLETRDSLGTLAALIIANKYGDDIQTIGSSVLIRDMLETVKELHSEYESHLSTLEAIL